MGLSSRAAQSAALPAANPELRELCAELYARSRAAQYGIAESDFIAVLQCIAQRYFAGCSATETADLLSSLQLEDLALAQACAAGNGRAWEVFLARFRARLYEAAFAIARN